MEKSKRVVGYARVSTEAQDITRQIELITAYCSDRNYHLIKIIQEKISGARKDRKSLNELLDVDDAVADMIIVSELSRLSREDDILSVLSTINELLKQGVDILFLDKQDRIYKAGTILSLYDIITLSVEAKASADERYKIASGWGAAAGIMTDFWHTIRERGCCSAPRPCCWTSCPATTGTHALRPRIF